MSWEKTTVGEIVTTRKGYAFKSSKYVNKGVPVVRVSDYTMDSISDADLKYYPYDEKQNYIDYELHEKDVIVQTVGSWQNNPAYNSEQDRANIEKTFMELMDLANSMNEEEQRYVREGFSSDEELSMYDMLFDENLSKEDIKKIKKVAVDLLDKIKTKIAELDHWTDKQETKAEVDNLIGKILWEELPESYSDSAIFECRKLIFEYVFMRYKQVA